MDTALCQCSWSFYITIMSEQIHGRHLWNCHWDLFSKIGSCVCSGSGMPSTTLCVFHWTTVSVSIGFMKVETSLQSFVYNFCAHYNQSSNRDIGQVSCQHCEWSVALTLCYLLKCTNTEIFWVLSQPNGNSSCVVFWSFISPHLLFLSLFVLFCYFFFLSYVAFCYSHSSKGLISDLFIL